MVRPSTPNTEVDYNDWNVYDYPSIGQIAEALRRNNIFPIFAAEANAKPIYDVICKITCASLPERAIFATTELFLAL